MPTNKPNKGMSSIIFAIAFVTILSLLSIGFATIARRDTNEVLDRTLSYQAQYAAESGINYGIDQIRNGKPSPSTCTPNTLSPGVDITCVTWDLASDNKVIMNNIGANPKNFKLVPTGDAISKIKLQWSYKTYSIPDYLDNVLPVLDGASVLKIALAKDTSDNNTNNLMYAVASTAGTGSENIKDGQVVVAKCDGTSKVCELTLAVDNNSWYLALSTLGNQIDNLTVQALGSSGNPVQLKDAQYLIDSNAIANGVTKRIQARIPINQSSWLPASALNVNRICKDIKIDGNNNTNISGFNYTNPLFGCPDTVNVPPDPPGDVNVVDIGGGGGSGGNSAGDDATVGTQTGTPGKPGSSKIYPYWSFYPSILNSTIPDAQRDYCTWQVVYSSKSNASFAEMEKVGGLITDTGAQCYNGVTKSFTAGNSTSKGAPKCNIAKCNRAGYYNAEFYLYAKDGRVVGPRYRTTGLGAPANYCRPFIFDKGREVCQANP